MNEIKSSSITTRLWLYTSFCFGCILFTITVWQSPAEAFLWLLLGWIPAIIGSLPALIILNIVFESTTKKYETVKDKFLAFLLLQFFITLLYGLFAAFTVISLDLFGEDNWQRFFESLGITTGILFASSCAATAIIQKTINKYFQNQINTETQTNNYMETNYPSAAPQYSYNPKPSYANKTFLKGIITGVLILVFLIPAYFVNDLVTERKDRKDKIENDADNSWAGNQTLSGPYLYIPYKGTSKHLIVLPKNLAVNGNIIPEDRQRSIYKVLLYRSEIKANGSFVFNLSKDIDTSQLDLSSAKICFGLSDYKGIEDKIVLHFNNNDYELAAGLPTNDIDSNGLSAPVQLTDADTHQILAFNYDVKIKGSGRLHFLPVSGNSSFALQSTWASPSFDGNTIPNENKVSDSGFTAKWIFNKANLPFQTVLANGATIKDHLDFGVSILQPVDDYAKTERCIKYAIMFIGLTFSLFFVLEIMQKKPVHPVQYGLVGMALVIFYTLLLSISEFIHFDYAYLISSAATVALISLYAKSHFQKWKIAAVFAGVLGGLYTFNYVLISLEDTALLVGSIALFIVVAVIMYATRKVNWYANTADNLSREVA